MVTYRQRPEVNLKVGGSNPGTGFTAAIVKHAKKNWYEKPVLTLFSVSRDIISPLLPPVWILKLKRDAVAQSRRSRTQKGSVHIIPCRYIKT